jgi:hypothetical protein
MTRMRQMSLILRATFCACALAWGLAGAALAQGNDATTTGAAAGRGSTGNAVQVGVLTTTEVTTGQSGPASRGNNDEGGRASGGRRQRVLAPVCEDLRDQPDVLAQCRAKAGM